ncbi:MAG: hypothetical protein WC777_00515 [Candidatus Gracilibacteria bacterium]|jgi:hypothetical protein
MDTLVKTEKAEQEEELQRRIKWTAVQPYIKLKEDGVALSVEKGRTQSRKIDPKLARLLDEYKLTYGGVSESSQPTEILEETHTFTGKDTLISHRGGEPFVQKTFKGEDLIPYKGLTPQQMNFMIQARVRRVLSETSLGARLLGISYKDCRIISEPTPGKRLREAMALEEIPDAHVERLVQGLVEMHDGGLSVHLSPSSTAYDASTGFHIAEALPSSRLITEITDEEYEVFRHHYLGTRRAVFIKDAVSNLTMSEQLLSGAKLGAYVLSTVLPKDDHRYNVTLSPEVHSPEFQIPFMQTLHRVLAIVKERHPNLLPDLCRETSLHIENLGKNIESFGRGMGYHIAYRFVDVPKENSLLAHPGISAQVEKIQALITS